MSIDLRTRSIQRVHDHRGRYYDEANRTDSRNEDYLSDLAASQHATFGGWDSE